MGEFGPRSRRSCLAVAATSPYSLPFDELRTGVGEGWGGARETPPPCGHDPATAGWPSKAYVTITAEGGLPCNRAAGGRRPFPSLPHGIHPAIMAVVQVLARQNHGHGRRRNSEGCGRLGGPPAPAMADWQKELALQSKDGSMAGVLEGLLNGDIPPDRGMETWLFIRNGMMR